MPPRSAAFLPLLLLLPLLPGAGPGPAAPALTDAEIEEFLRGFLAPVDGVAGGDGSDVRLGAQPGTGGERGAGDGGERGPGGHGGLGEGVTGWGSWVGKGAGGRVMGWGALGWG